MRDASDDEDIRDVRAFLTGDTEAFRSLFDKYRERVYGIAYRFVRNKEDALEVTQDVFLRVYQNLAQFQTNSRFFTWLYRIAVNRSIDFTRSRKAQPARGVDPTTLDSGLVPAHSAPGPVEVARERELAEKLAVAIDSLSEKHRAVFLLHAVENLSYKQIADTLECNLGTVMSRLFYARKKLSESLTQLGVELPAGFGPGD